MIAFGCATTDERRFRAGAAKAIEGAAELDSLLMRRRADGWLAEPYDEMLAEAAQHDDLEAVVLLDQSVSQLDAGLASQLRGLLAVSSDIAVVGAASAGGTREVDSVGGPLLILSAWAVRELRCDPSVAGAFGPLAMDLSFQARARERRVVASEALGAVCGPRFEPLSQERRAWLRAAAAVRRKWRADIVPWWMAAA